MGKTFNITTLQKELIIWIIFFLVVASWSGYYIDHIPNQHPGIIRLHVIANSDSAGDQEVKLKVRDAILVSMPKDLSSAEETRSYLNTNMNKVVEVAEKTLRENGYNYPARAKIKVTHISERTYDNITFPEGNYEALNITLGTGNGHNWWCVIYPQLCLVQKKSKKEKIVLKSKVKEIMKKKLSTEK